MTVAEMADAYVAYIDEGLRKKAVPGAFMTGLMGTAQQGLRALEKITPQQLLGLSAALLPVMAATQLMDLTPTGDVLGTYLKNKLVPGLEESNMSREMELQSKLEMGAKQLPMLNASTIGMENDRFMRQNMVEEALTKKDEIMEAVEQDEFLIGFAKDKLEKLVDDAIRIAPMVMMDMPTVVISIIRAAALTGADSIGVTTANELATLEKTYIGRR